LTRVAATWRAEGGLLTRELVDRAVRLDPTLAGTAETDYGLAPGERVQDAITRSWNRLQGVWEAFRRALAELPASDQAATALTRERWLRPLLDELGFPGLPVAKAVAIDGKDYPVSHLWGATVPVHLPGARVPIDKMTRGVPGAARMSPHGLVQELLNRSDDCLWGIVSNGLLLRVLRDNASLTRQAFVEFDVEAMFDGEAYSDFVVLWLCCHRTRFEGEPAEKCLLEQWATEAASMGTRALENLRAGVEAAIEALGEGFVAHPANGVLRGALRSRELSAPDLQRQLLRLVYRLLFLLVAESRGLLLAPGAGATVADRYRRFYSMERLRTLAAKRRGSAHGDLWVSLGVVMRALHADGAPELGLAPLGSQLWSPEATSHLNGASLDNRHLLAAVRHLCFVRDADARVLRSVDYRNLGAEELGSVYESLLELHAEVDDAARAFTLETAAGHERKTTGSYYTPTPLIRVLLDSALDPVLDEAVGAPDPEKALLSLKVLDPAAGSGHFLIAAAHRIANRLASVRAGGAEPSPSEVRGALRDVIGRCLHGIDVNPMAVELCKVSLWMEAQEPGRPLSFLDHRIVCGNSLLGATPALVEAGVPDAAFKELLGDDKEVARAWRSMNKRERTHGSAGMFHFGSTVAEDMAALAEGVAEIDAIDDVSVDGIAAKETRLAKVRASDAARRAKLAADAWCAAFVVPKVKGGPVVTDAVVRTCGSTPDKVPADVLAAITNAADRYRFLHPHVAFPDVFCVPDDPDDADNELCGWSGGFDVVLGNPPWERVKLQEKEWFAVRDPAIATAPNAAARKKLIAALVEENSGLHAEFVADARKAEGESALLRNTGRYPLGGRGDVNTYAVFAELMRKAISRTGRVGVIVPTGIATDDTTKHFFADLVERRSLVSLYDFENSERLFPGIATINRFCLLTMLGLDRQEAAPKFVFFAQGTADIEEEERRFTLSAADFALLNPNTRTCPVFRTRRDAEITKTIYRRVPVLVKDGDTNGNPWSVTFSTMFHMSNDSHLFRTREQLEAGGYTLDGNHLVRGKERYLPLYEAKMAHHFNHRDGDYTLQTTTPGRGVRTLRGASADLLNDPAYVVTPRYWVSRDKLGGETLAQGYLVGFRNITNTTTNRRTVVAFVLPVSGVGHSTPILRLGRRNRREAAILVGLLDSYIFDYVTRQKIGGTNLTFHVLKQLPAPPPESIRDPGGIAARVLELTYTAWDLERFAADLGYRGPPFRWDDERRALLRAELDALMFRLYRIERDDVDYILDTFPIVRRKDEAAFGEYRTKRLILVRYDAMAAAEAAGRAYETMLDPPPAHPSQSHPESTRPSWAELPHHDD
jgi:N-6 DNA Methylase